jgi:hypothetical protein
MSSKRKRVLFVAYLFPPVGGVGVHRATKFVKFLPEFGWDCSVLTASNPSAPLFDESLLKNIPAETIIRKAKTYEPGYAMKSMVSASNGTAQKSGLKCAILGGMKSVARERGSSCCARSHTMRSLPLGHRSRRFWLEPLSPRRPVCP